MKILTGEEIRLAEREAAENWGLSEVALMENAGGEIAETVLKNSEPWETVCVLCGRGNNGGDGFVAARRLIGMGRKTTVFHFDDADKFSPSAAVNFKILEKMKADSRLFKEPYDFSGFGVIVDALLGTGLSRPLEGEIRKIAEAANFSPALKIAADIPTGLKSDETVPEGSVLRADITVSFTALKICQSLYPAKSFCGKVIVKDISVPAVNVSPKRELLSRYDLPPLKKRPPFSHKGDNGKVLCVGGSEETPGAAAIASWAALKTGAGLVTCAYPKNIGGNFLGSFPELMRLPFVYENPGKVLDFLRDKADILIIGNGMGRSPEAVKFIREIVFNGEKPMIIDADGLNALKSGELKDIKNKAVLTPHQGEFARLIGKDIKTVESDRLNLARDLAATSGALLILKSADTIIALPEGSVFIADFGSPVLAKGGSGDSLAGITGGLAAQGYSLEESAALACFILGESGKKAAKKYGEETVTAGDIINNLGAALNELR